MSSLRLTISMRSRGSFPIAASTCTRTAAMHLDLRDQSSRRRPCRGARLCSRSSGVGRRAGGGGAGTIELGEDAAQQIERAGKAYRDRPRSPPPNAGQGAVSFVETMVINEKIFLLSN
jgi:hypothetical protein